MELQTVDHFTKPDVGAAEEQRKSRGSRRNLYMAAISGKLNNLIYQGM